MKWSTDLARPGALCAEDFDAPSNAGPAAVPFELSLPGWPDAAGRGAAGFESAYSSLAEPPVPPDPAPEPAADPPAGAAEQEAAAEAAYAEGLAMGEARAATRYRGDVTEALARLAAALAASRDAHAAAAGHAAEDVARILLAAFRAAFPALCAAHGAGEARAVARAVLPVLRREPMPTITANPATLPALRDELAAHDADIPLRTRLRPDPALAPGDVRLAWRDGEATRDVAAIWTEIEAILTAAALRPAARPSAAVARDDPGAAWTPRYSIVTANPEPEYAV